MRAPSIIWTTEIDDRIRALRATPMTWNQVARELDLDEAATAERGRFIGLGKPAPTRVQEQPHHAELVRAAIAAGRSRQSIADETGLARYRIDVICKRLGLTVTLPKIERPITSSTAAPYRPVITGMDAIPAGHPETWGMITAGTVLEGEPYPCP